MKLPLVKTDLCLDCPARPGNGGHADLLEEAAELLSAWYRGDVGQLSAFEVGKWLERYKMLPNASYAEALGVKDESKGL